MNLRGRIRQNGIRCLPWRIWRGELESMPISSQTLFRRRGLPFDVLERELASEGYLRPDENLIDVLRIEINLFRVPMGEETLDGVGGFPDDWTEEDFIDFYERG
jgi:hypothetical protein